MKQYIIFFHNISVNVQGAKKANFYIVDMNGETVLNSPKRVFYDPYKEHAALQLAGLVGKTFTDKLKVVVSAAAFSTNKKSHSVVTLSE